MSNLEQIRARRAVLINRGVRQRAELGELCGQWERPAGLIDKGYALARSVRLHPRLALTLGLAAVFLLRKHISIGRIAGIALTTARLGKPLERILLSRKPTG
jgi:hypothetical protein